MLKISLKLLIWLNWLNICFSRFASLSMVIIELLAIPLLCLISPMHQTDYHCGVNLLGSLSWARNLQDAPASVLNITEITEMSANISVFRADRYDMV